MEYQWQYIDVDAEKVSLLHDVLKIKPVLCELLVKRGIENYDAAKDFFRPSLDQLHPPLLMRDMEKAVSRIELAIKHKERILFYGDYDVDGTTSVSLCYLFFKQFYDHIDYYIPDRNKEGYGISYEGIDYAKEHNCPLVVALDCGIKAIDKINYANDRNIDFIICDHHTPGEEIPKAHAILNPKQANCTYPYKELSGCGIGFKLCQAYAEKNFIKLEKLFQFLDLLCISIACDIVPVTGENRILAKFGLAQLNQSPSVGVGKMISLLDLDKEFTIMDVVFKIGPRINAAGRMAHAHAAVKVLVGEEDGSILQSNNEDRQVLDKEITQSALQYIEASKHEDLVTNVVFDPSWHKGVVGIVASRIIEHHYKPTVVLCESNGKLTGSARSVKGFNIYEPLDACSDLMLNFGGHAYAAGLTLEPENLEAFKTRFNEEVAKRIQADDLIPKIPIDSVLRLEDITDSYYKVLKQFAPFGPRNMQPIFESRALSDTGYSKIVGTDHLKLSLKDEKGNRINGIAFRMGDKLSLLQDGKIDVCYTLNENHWNGRTNLEITVKDIRTSTKKS
ncbi:MAG: single-stranded-DNA-specific exonuclease [Chitinophagales bacterium]|jgi:single-stranded-DNA-specific exonuclease